MNHRRIDPLKLFVGRLNERFNGNKLEYLDLTIV